jgi:hypothetical protein
VPAICTRAVSGKVLRWLGSALAAVLLLLVAVFGLLQTQLGKAGWKERSRGQRAVLILLFRWAALVESCHSGRATGRKLGFGSTFRLAEMSRIDRKPAQHSAAPVVE